MPTNPTAAPTRRRLIAELDEAEQLRDAVKRDVDELAQARADAIERHDVRLRDLRDRNATVRALEYQLAATLDDVSKAIERSRAEQVVDLVTGIVEAGK